MEQYVCTAKECTLCMACLNVCPRDAVRVGVDENGYDRVEIDSSRCIDCGLCRAVCQRRSTVSRTLSQTAYAAQAIDQKALAKSASGGGFQMLAQTVLEHGGVCYGCEFVNEKGYYQAKHVRIDTIEDLPRILNSKYIPSMIAKVYQQAKQDLESGKYVLFSGTPCQIQGLRAYLNREYQNLWTADVICHGITSTKLFNDYVDCIEHRDGVEIVDYCFRDKSVSWGTNFCYTYRNAADPKTNLYSKHCPREESSYMAHYLRGDIFRENCYHCECANLHRVSDFTLGDYWEIEREHPEFVTKLCPRMTLHLGVSCILINTPKASALLQKLAEKMILREVTIDSVIAHNENLCAPSKKGSQREWVLATYIEGGYGLVDDIYRKNIGKKLFFYRIKNFLKSYLPDSLRIWIYRSPLLSRIVFHK